MPKKVKTKQNISVNTGDTNRRGKRFGFESIRGFVRRRRRK